MKRVQVTLLGNIAILFLSFSLLAFSITHLINHRLADERYQWSLATLKTLQVASAFSNRFAPKNERLDWFDLSETDLVVANALIKDADGNIIFPNSPRQTGENPGIDKSFGIKDSFEPNTFRFQPVTLFAPDHKSVLTFDIYRAPNNKGNYALDIGAFIFTLTFFAYSLFRTVSYHFANTLARTLPVDGDQTAAITPGASFFKAVERNNLSWQTLQKHQHRLLSVIEATSDFVSFADSELNIQYLNQGGRELLGIGDKNLAGIKVDQLHPAWASQKIIGEGLPTARSRGTWQGETAIVDQAGKEIQVSQVISCHRNEIGDIEYYSTIIRNIDDSKQLRKVNQQLASIVQYSHDFIGLADLKGVAQFVNDAGLKMVGLSSTESRIPIEQYIHESSHHLLKEEVLPKIMNDGHWSGLLNFQYFPSGTAIPTQSEAFLIKDADGEPINIATVSRNISERLTTEKALKQSEERLRQALRVSNIGIFDHDHLSDEIYWSPEQRKIHGWAPDKPIKLEEFIASVHPEDKNKIDVAVRIAHNPSGNGVYDVEHRIIRPDGEVRWIMTRSQTFFGVSGGVFFPARTVGADLDITETKKAEADLHLKECGIAASINAIAFCDLNGRLGYVNKAFLQMWGYPNESEVLGHSVAEFLIDPVEANENLAALIDREHLTKELKAKRRDGTGFIVLVSATVITDRHGEPIQLMGSFIDITESRQVETALRHSEALLAEAQRIGHMGSWELDIVNNKLHWSDEIFRIFEIDKNFFSATYEAFVEKVHPEDRECVNRAYTESVANKTPYDIVHRLLMHNGRVKYVHELCETTYNPSGQPIRSIGTVQDITESKLAEMELQTYRDHLQELVNERTKLVKDQAQIIDQIHDSVVTTDLNGFIQFWNLGANRIFGYSFEEAVGQHISFLYPEEGRQALAKEIIEPLLIKGEHDCEAYTLCKNGEMLYIHLSLSLLYDDKGKPNRMVGYAIDISPRKKMEEELHQKANELAAVNKELEAFTYSVSHDLRSPLRAIDGFSLALLEDFSDVIDDTGKNYLRRVRAGAQKMDALIDDLLSLSRVTRATMTRENVDLTEIGREIIARFRQTEPNRQIEITIKDGLKARGDRGLIRIVLENLLGNAWKYTSQKVLAQVEFGSLEEENTTVFYIKDNGAGFDIRYKEKLFGAFQRLHQASEFPGNGIGLATVQRIILRHGGRIWAHSELGNGAIFYFILANPMES